MVQSAVVMAYHLILETSFLLDQSAMFSTIPFSGVPSLLPTDRQSPSVQPSNSQISCLVEPTAETDSPCTIDVPISNGYHEEGSHDLNLALEGNSTFSNEPYNPVILSGLSSLSASLKKVIGDSFPLFSSASCQSMSTYFGFNERDTDSHSTAALRVSTSPEAFDQDVEVKGSSDEDKASDHDQSNSPSACFEASSDAHKSVENRKDQMQNKDEISTVLDSESILVLMSSRNASRGTICGQSHLSHIKFYRNFDAPLGKFLQDNLLNQVIQNSICLDIFLYCQFVLPDEFYRIAECNFCL